eukprot:CAMPEP_0184647868 /NCGR_PEP_ID=MMETSP0308-20130426/4893_1 /TAXON_ID=38269 /ORGANISM="Gloeochaete witrockiana, Strain SAG 46.84" /LENGTH=212 /DNA_ID=CAMNT_0027079239 /DNA_START=1417 /DNA_END=2056 /DNA_ORIENTATION=+
MFGEDKRGVVGGKKVTGDILTEEDFADASERRRESISSLNRRGTTDAEKRDRAEGREKRWEHMDSEKRRGAMEGERKSGAVRRRWGATAGERRRLEVRSVNQMGMTSGLKRRGALRSERRRDDTWSLNIWGAISGLQTRSRTGLEEKIRVMEGLSITGAQAFPKRNRIEGAENTMGAILRCNTRGAKGRERSTGTTSRTISLAADVQNRSNM